MHALLDNVLGLQFAELAVEVQWCTAVALYSEAAAGTQCASLPGLGVPQRAWLRRILAGWSS